MTYLPGVCRFKAWPVSQHWNKGTGMFFQASFKLLFFVSQNVNEINQHIQTEDLSDLQSSFTQLNRETQKSKFLWKTKDVNLLMKIITKWVWELKWSS